MINVVIGGATGKVGRHVCERIMKSEDMKLVGAIVSPNGDNIGKEVYPGVIGMGPESIEAELEDADIYVDLTSPDAASKIVADIPNYGVNLIVGTTAIPQDVIDRMTANVAKNNTAALVSVNFAMGVNVFWKMCSETAKNLPGYDIEIIEMHHASKVDAPSGTSKETLKVLQEATGIEKVIYGREGDVGPRTREICVHSVRAGDTVGDHTVIFAKDKERIELTHKAISREVFADGCIASIRWMADKKDGKVHSMKEVFGL